MSFEKEIKLVEELCMTPGISGHEEKIAEIIERELKDVADDIEKDLMGNIIVTKKGSSKKGPKVMLAAHMDEIGLMVRFIDDNADIDDYNPQQVVKSAEQDFNIIKCFAESKNSKKNLMNLVRSNELKNWEYMNKNNGRMRANRRMNLLNLNSLNYFMKMYHINQIRGKYEPDKAEKNNDEKTKLLTLECAKLEEMQNQCIIKKELLRNQILGYKTKKQNNIIYK